MSNITGPLRGASIQVPKGGPAPLPDDLVKESAALAKDYLAKGGEVPDDLVEAIAAKVEAHLASQGKTVDAAKLRDGIRHGLAQLADRPAGSQMTDNQLEGAARGGLTSLIAQLGGKPGIGTHGM
ncbi:MAG: hypothetical protein FJZ01_05620 [Candidatus Sericytochromatia bacterium]|nr:hypothetical protein [Candidatus Tanganyikabacteria bacterium]